MVIRRIAIVAVVIGLVAVAPALIRKIRYPQVLESKVSSDGLYIASIQSVPLGTDGVLGYFGSILDLVFQPTATRVYASVREVGRGEPTFWIPLDLGNDCPSDYLHTSKVAWISPSKVKFDSLRGTSVAIETGNPDVLFLHAAPSVHTSKPAGK